MGSGNSEPGALRLTSLGWQRVPDSERDKPADWRQHLLKLMAIGVTPVLLNGFYRPALIQIPILLWAEDLLIFVVLPAVILALSLRAKLVTFSELGLDRRVNGRRSPRKLLALLVGVPLILLFAYGMAIRVAWLLLPDAGQLVTHAQLLPPRSAGPVWQLAVVYMAVSAGVVEELYYRAMARQLFESDDAGRALYVLGSSLLFGIAHWEFGVQSVLAATLFGVCAALMFLRWRNLWPLIVGHAFVDLMLLS